MDSETVFPDLLPGGRRVSMSLAVVVTVVVTLVAMATLEGAGPAQASAPGLVDRSALAVHAGDLTVTEDGAVIENLEIRGTLRIAADNVTVRNVWVYTTSFWTVYVESGSAVFEHVEIGKEGVVGERGIGGHNVVVRWADIHHVEDGIKLGSNSQYEHVRVHDLDSSSPDPHADAVQADGGITNAVVRDSSLDSTGPLGFGNAAALIESSLGPIDSVTIERSYLNGGAYTVFVRDGGHGMPTNVHIRGNVFGPTNAYGYVSSDGPVDLAANTFDSVPPAPGGTAIGDPPPPTPGTTDGASGDAVLGGAGMSSGRLSPPSIANGTFTDDDGSLYESDIELLAVAGLTQGCAPMRFCPSKVVTRAEMAVFFVRALGEDPAPGGSFTDVATSAWYSGSAERMRQLGLVTGCESDRYCPDAPMSRAEMAVILARLLPGSGEPVGLFVDVPAGSWFGTAVGIVHSRGLTNGCSSDPLQFCPTEPVTRGEMASFLARTFGL